MRFHPGVGIKQNRLPGRPGVTDEEGPVADLPESFALVERGKLSDFRGGQSDRGSGLLGLAGLLGR